MTQEYAFLLLIIAALAFAVVVLLSWLYYSFSTIKNTAVQLLTDLSECSDDTYRAANNTRNTLISVQEDLATLLNSKEEVIKSLQQQLVNAKQRANVAESKLNAAGISARTISRKKV